MMKKKVRMMVGAPALSANIPKTRPVRSQGLNWCTADDKELHITVRTQEEAVVVSCDFHLQGEKACMMAALQTEMEQLASNVESHGGIVGHIKASVECQDTAVISVTLDRADVRCGNTTELQGSFAAIVLFLDETKARELVETMFENVKMKIQTVA